MNSKELCSLNRKRGNLKSQITKLWTFVKEEANSASEIIIRGKLEIGIRIRKNFDELKEEYYDILSDKEFEEQEKPISDIDEELNNLEVSFKTLLHEINIKKIETQNISIKLPEIPLPKFSGKFEDWFQFKSQFATLIDSNKQLNDMQKLYYLQSSLLGPAKLIQTQDDNYNSLMKALEQRFENKRLIVTSHLNFLMSREKLKTDSAVDLRILIDNILKHLRALKQLELESNGLTEIILIKLIEQRLDSEFRKQFEMTLTNSEIPTLEQFLDFLQKRCCILENLNSQSGSKSLFSNKSK